jgi:hypothetical protein
MTSLVARVSEGEVCPRMARARRVVATRFCASAQVGATYRPAFAERRGELPPRGVPSCPLELGERRLPGDRLRSLHELDGICVATHSVSSMVDVVVTDVFEGWYDALGGDDRDAVYRVVSLLEAKGVSLGFPPSSAIVGSSIALRELRSQSQGKPLRVFYAFDPKRQAVLLLGGDKTGDDRFYERMIPLAEGLWREYLAGG